MILAMEENVRFSSWKNIPKSLENEGLCRNWKTSPRILGRKFPGMYRISLLFVWFALLVDLSYGLLLFWEVFPVFERAVVGWL